MGQLSCQFQHGGAGIQHHRIAGLHIAGGELRDGLLLRQVTLHLLQRGRLRRDKAVQRDAAVAAANHPFLVQLNQIAANGGWRSRNGAHQLFNSDQIMTFEIVHNLVETALSLHISLCKLHREFNRDRHARRVRFTCPGDIKCRAVVGGSADKRQSRRDVDAIVKAKQFQRDMPLIV
ncbi:hypothetical protein COLO4_02589, partial [Corchorus olitorius]